ncbi:uncharacterized protein J4E78_001001 [Alternaria triticimaculans]|uniref:uncharacterized protein n=1 Tax=Alternaria triticimaculans TaxID=297637 RepID=UPI0020C5625A|nr:uncharacterized protein J4E78_001001 [Alternaria triticimaculans]KAI4672500.1 hypothetical protein J4E78_001001 [Alternaria triticimaculans]
MFTNLQIRPAKTRRRKPSLSIRAGVSKRRVSTVSALSASIVPSVSFMEGLFGDEFPEAFGSGAQNRKTITDLPSELLEIVCQHISKLDIKRLRLTSKHLAASVYLRIDRVYISPNRANLDYLHQIMAHPTYKNRVLEIVWDDALLNEYSTLDEFRQAVLADEREVTRAIESRLEEAMELYGDENPEHRSLSVADLIEDGRLTEIAKGILLRYDDHFSRDVLARNATMMSIEDSYALYQELYRQEQELVEQQVDAAALHEALASFPSVKRITTTIDVWPAWNVSPRYNTPYHRSLPMGFRKPTIWPWLRPPQEAERIYDQWSSRAANPKDNGESLPRGYGVVVDAILAMPNPRIEKFIVESEHQARQYHHCFIAKAASHNYQITKQMFQRTPLKHVKLTVTPSNDYLYDEESLTNLQSLLAELRYLEHLDLSLNDKRSARTLRRFLQFNPIPEALRPQLKTLTLRNIKLSPQDLLDLFTSSVNLQHVTLYHCFQRIPPQYGFPWLFHKLRKHYRDTKDVSKPGFRVAAPLSGQYSQVVDDEVDAFLYDEDEPECPFSKMPPPDRKPNEIKPHMGWKVWDKDESVRERMAEVIEREEMQERDEEM